MARPPLYDLDRLGPERFQEICAALIVKYFSEVVLPFGSPGRDGGIDLLSKHPPRHYSEFFEHAFGFLDQKEKHSIWVYQCKHHSLDRITDRQKAIIADWKKEVAEWASGKREKHAVPTHLFLLTNVRLTPKTRKTLVALTQEAFGNQSVYFECWDGAKIGAFIAIDAVLRDSYWAYTDMGDRAFHPDDLRKLTHAIEQLKTAPPSQVIGPRRDSEASHTIEWISAIAKLKTRFHAFINTLYSALSYDSNSEKRGPSQQNELPKLDEQGMSSPPSNFESRRANELGIIVFISLHCISSTNRSFYSNDDLESTLVRLDMINTILQSKGGKLTRIFGDGALACFSEPYDCVNTLSQIAREMKVIDRNDSRSATRKFYLRIGVSYGEFLIPSRRSIIQDNICGQVVSKAARLSRQAHLDQFTLVCDDSCIQKIEDYPNWSFIGSRPLRGNDIAENLYRVNLTRDDSM